MAKDKANIKIISFWEWFETHERSIKGILEDELHPERDELVQTMDNHILGLGLFTWEMGTVGSNSFYLTISPNGDPYLLELSKSIVAASPALPYWTFYYAKPVKEEPIELKLYDEEYNLHFVNAQKWQFGLSLSQNGKVDITIVAKNMRHLDHETQTEASGLVISSLLGEENKILYIGKVYVLTHFNSEEPAKLVTSQALKNEFDMLLQKKR